MTVVEVFCLVKELASKIAGVGYRVGKFYLFLLTPTVTPGHFTATVASFALRDPENTKKHQLPDSAPGTRNTNRFQDSPRSPGDLYLSAPEILTESNNVWIPVINVIRVHPSPVPGGQRILRNASNLSFQCGTTKTMVD